MLSAKGLVQAKHASATCPFFAGIFLLNPTYILNCNFKACKLTAVRPNGRKIPSFQIQSEPFGRRWFRGDVGVRFLPGCCRTKTFNQALVFLFEELGRLG